MGFINMFSTKKISKIVKNLHNWTVKVTENVTSENVLVLPIKMVTFEDTF